MKRMLTFLSSLVFLISCSTEPEKVIETTYDDGDPKLVRFYEQEESEKVLVKEMTYYPNDNLRYVGEYKDKKRHGHWIYYYRNGKKWSEGFFLNGERNGEAKTCHENGQLYIQGEYTDGKRTGTWKFWDKNGEMMKEINYDE